MNRLSAISLFAAVTLAFSASACSDSPVSSPADSGSSAPSPYGAKLIDAPRGATIIEDSYIVVFRDDVVLHDASASGQSALLKVAASYDRQYPDIDIATTFDNGVTGFSARIPESRLASLLADPRVAYIERDQRVSIGPFSTMDPAGFAGKRTPAPSSPTTTTSTPTEPTATTQVVDWGVSYAGGDSSSTISGNNTGAVSGVEVFIIDTGIDPSHSELNVVGGINYGNLDRDSTAWFDEHGHGTHVAGIVGARDNSAWTAGVAPGVRLYSVRVFGPTGSGSITGILQGLSWIRRQRTLRPTTPMVANMSIVSSASLSLDRSVKALIDSGVTVVVAAGNNQTLAANYSPARLPEAITVAATANNGTLASFSNYGSAVDILAPGVSINSTRWQGGVVRKSGTSMATPHVTGAAALYLSLTGNGSKTPAEVATAIINAAPAWGVSLPSGTPNRMLRVRTF